MTALLLNTFFILHCHTAFAKELRIAIFPFSVHTQDDISYIRDGITSLLPSRVAASGRLSVIDSFLIRSELGKLPAEHPLSAGSRDNQFRFVRHGKPLCLFVINKSCFF